MDALVICTPPAICASRTIERTAVCCRTSCRCACAPAASAARTCTTSSMAASAPCASRSRWCWATRWPASSRTSGRAVKGFAVGETRRHQPEPALRPVPLLPAGPAQPLPGHAVLRQRDAHAARAGRLSPAHRVRDQPGLQAGRSRQRRRRLDGRAAVGGAARGQSRRRRCSARACWSRVAGRSARWWSSPRGVAGADAHRRHRHGDAAPARGDEGRRRPGHQHRRAARRAGRIHRRQGPVRRALRGQRQCARAAQRLRRAAPARRSHAGGAGAARSPCR